MAETRLPNPGNVALQKLGSFCNVPPSPGRCGAPCHVAKCSHMVHHEVGMQKTACSSSPARLSTARRSSLPAMDARCSSWCRTRSAAASAPGRAYLQSKAIKNPVPFIADYH